MTLKSCQICYQVESDTLNYFYKNSFSNKNDVAVKFEFEVKEFFFLFLGVFKIFFGFCLFHVERTLSLIDFTISIKVCNKQ